MKKVNLILMAFINLRKVQLMGEKGNYFYKFYKIIILFLMNKHKSEEC